MTAIEIFSRAMLKIFIPVIRFLCFRDIRQLSNQQIYIVLLTKVSQSTACKYMVTIFQINSAYYWAVKMMQEKNREQLLSTAGMLGRRGYF